MLLEEAVCEGYQDWEWGFKFNTALLSWMILLQRASLLQEKCALSFFSTRNKTMNAYRPTTKGLILVAQKENKG